MEDSTMPPSPRRSTRDRRPVEALTYDSTALSPDGKRRVSTQETAEEGSLAATPIHICKKRRLIKNHVTPSSPVTTPSFVFPTPSNPTTKKIHVTPSSIQPKADNSHNTTTTALPTVVSRRGKQKQHGLAKLSQSFHHIVTTSGSNDVDLQNVVDQLGIPKRRIYDVVNILEGAGLMKRSASSRNAYSWNPAPRDHDYEIKKLKEEERQLDVWIQITTEEVENVQSYITPQHVIPLLDKDATALAIATPRKSILHLPHDLEHPHETGPHHVFTLIPPKDHDPRRCMLPKVFLLESGDESMHDLSLVPPLSLFEKCCSDITFSALNQFLHGWDDASDDAQSLLRSLARSQDICIKPPHCALEVKNKTLYPVEMIKDNNNKAASAMPVVTAEASSPMMNHALLWDNSHEEMNHAFFWDYSHNDTTTPHDVCATQKFPQGNSTKQPHHHHHHSWEEQMAEQLLFSMPSLFQESGSLVLCEGA